jgi:hypothetical protein
VALSEQHECALVERSPSRAESTQPSSCVEIIDAISVYTHDRAAGVIGIPDGEAENSNRLEEIAGRLIAQDRTINRRVRRIIVQSYS